MNSFPVAVRLLAACGLLGVLASGAVPAGSRGALAAGPTFQKTYRSGDLDRAVAVAGPLADGGFLLVGQTGSHQALWRDILVVRIDASGDVLWSKVYGGSGDDLVAAVAATADGGFLIVGSTWRSSVAFGYAMYALRIDGSGNILWSKTYGGNYPTYGSAVAGPLADGGFLLVGSTYRFGTRDMYAVRIDPWGNVLWSKAYGGDGDDQAQAVAGPLSDGGFLLVGSTNSFGAGWDDMYAVRIDASGDVVWSKTYGGGYQDFGNAVAAADGGFLLLGLTSSFGGGLPQMYAVRTDGLGNVVWSRTYRASNNDSASDVVARADGGFLLVGWSDGNIYTVRINGSGAVLWSRTYGVALASSWARRTLGLADGGFLLVGYTGGTDTDWTYREWMYLVRTDSLGFSGCNEGTPTTQIAIPETQTSSPSTRASPTMDQANDQPTQTFNPSTATKTFCPLSPTPTPTPWPTATPTPTPGPSGGYKLWLPFIVRN